MALGHGVLQAESAIVLPVMNEWDRGAGSFGSPELM